MNLLTRFEKTQETNKETGSYLIRQKSMGVCGHVQESFLSTKHLNISNISSY